MMNGRNVVYRDCYGNQCVAGVSSAREIAIDIAGGLGPVCVWIVWVVRRLVLGTGMVICRKMCGVKL